MCKKGGSRQPIELVRNHAFCPVEKINTYINSIKTPPNAKGGRFLSHNPGTPFMCETAVCVRSETAWEKQLSVDGYSRHGGDNTFLDVHPTHVAFPVVRGGT